MIVLLWLINLASALASRAMDACIVIDSDDNSVIFDVFSS